MDRKSFLKGFLGLAAIPAARLVWPLGHGAGAQEAVPAGATGGPGIRPLHKSKAEWRKLLPGAAFAVLFEEATERPFSSPLNDQHDAGIFICAACFLPLFDSSRKFDSGTGWPSFWAPMEGRLGTKQDFKLVVPRTEYHCVRCGGHQGHVFRDGPRPTGLRYCNNGLALHFVPHGQPLPALRT